MGGKGEHDGVPKGGRRRNKAASWVDRTAQAFLPCALGNAPPALRRLIEIDVRHGAPHFLESKC